MNSKSVGTDTKFVTIGLLVVQMVLQMICITSLLIKVDIVYTHQVYTIVHISQLYRHWCRELHQDDQS